MTQTERDCVRQYLRHWRAPPDYPVTAIVDLCNDADLLEAEVERLRAEVTTTRKAVKFIIGRNSGVPWRDVLEADVDSYVDEIRKREAAEAAGGVK